MKSRKAIILISVAAVAIAAAVAVFVIVRRKTKNKISDMNSNEKTAAGLVRYAKSQLGRPYWWGTSGQTATAALLKQKKAQYPEQYMQNNYTDAAADFGKRVHDCAGLIEAYMWSVDGSKDGKIVPNSNNFADTTANNMLLSAVESGPISTIPEIAGLTVHYNRHVGIYAGNGKVIEARGRNYGVVETNLKDRPFVYWAKIKGIKY